MKIQQQTQERYDQTKLEWNREQIKFDDTMTTVLQGMQSNEEARLNALSDALTKWAVFVTNLTANRNYDVKSLAETMSQISVKGDLQAFMRETLTKNPMRTLENMTPRSVYKFDDKNHHRRSSKSSSKSSSHSKIHPSLAKTRSINQNGSVSANSSSNSLRTQSLSMGQAKRRKSLSKSDLKKLASQFGNHGKKRSIDLSKHSNNNSSNSNSSNGNGNGMINNNNINNKGRHSRQNSGSENGREDSLSKRSISDLFRSNRMFRSNSNPNSNVGSKNHSRETSLTNNNGNGTIVPEDEQTILPMPAEMLANKERLVEPPPQPRNVCFCLLVCVYVFCF